MTERTHTGAGRATGWAGLSCASYASCSVLFHDGRWSSPWPGYFVEILFPLMITAHGDPPKSVAWKNNLTEHLPQGRI